MNRLDHFEIGYDRAYIGTALHCLLCAPDDPYDSDGIVCEDLADRPFSQVVTVAFEHNRIRHPDLA